MLAVAPPCGAAHSFELTCEARPVTARPEEPGARRAPPELVLLGGDERRDVVEYFLFRHGRQERIAICATACRPGPEDEVHVLIRGQLAQLSPHVIALQQSQAPAQYPALCEVSVACEEPSVFPEDASNELLVGNGTLVRRIVAEYPQPPCQLAQHRVGEESVR